MKSTITQVLLFHKRSVYPCPVVQILNPYHVEFLLMLCVYREGGCFDVVFCNAIFSKSELKPKSFSCQSNRIWKNNFTDNISNTFFFCLDLLANVSRHTNRIKKATFVVWGSVVLHD